MSMKVLMLVLAKVPYWNSSHRPLTLESVWYISRTGLHGPYLYFDTDDLATANTLFICETCLLDILGIKFAPKSIICVQCYS